MALKLANNAVSKLAANVAAADATISITAGDGTKFPVLAAGDWHPVTLIRTDGTLEILKCTARTNDTLTVTRGQEGTVATTFSTGDRVELRLTALAIQTINDLAVAALPATGTAADSSKLGGQLPSAYLGATAQAADSAKLGSNTANKYLMGGDIWTDGVFSGLTIATSANLSSTITAGKALVGAVRIATNATPYTFTASQDTYVDLKNDGTFAYLPVANGAASPAVTANAIRIAKVVTSASAITAVTDLRGAPTSTQAAVGSATKWNGASKTVSTAAPSGGVDGDIWLQYS